MVHLEPKSGSDVAAWLTTMWTDYREQLLGAGFTQRDASLNIERIKANLFVDGVPNGDQRLFDVLDDGARVGSLWLAKTDDPSAHEWFIYDVVIEPEFRGRGFGRSTMQAAEDYVRGQGGTRLSLNVFGPNVVARSLYESMGYSVLTVGMGKDLD